jgi:hypothetical protein
MLQLAAGLEAGWERQMEMANLVTGIGLAAAGLDLRNHLASATGDSGCPPLPPAEKRLAPCTLPARRMVKPWSPSRKRAALSRLLMWVVVSDDATGLPASCLQSPLRTRDGQMGGTARPGTARLGHGPFGPFNSRAVPARH